MGKKKGSKAAMTTQRLMSGKTKRRAKQVKAVLPPGERIVKVEDTNITYGPGDGVNGN